MEKDGIIWTPAKHGKAGGRVEFTWDAFLADCERPAAWRHKSSESNGRDFTGTDTYSEAMALARTGWTEGRDKMAAGLSVMAPAGYAAPSHAMDVAGAYPVAPLAAAGDPACMVAIGNEIVPRKVHRVLVSISTSGGTDKEVIVNRGAAVCAAVDAIEASDARCEVVAHFATKGRSGTVMHWLVTLKEADAPLEIDRMAFALAHPAMLRRLVFRQIELRLPEGEFAGGYGSPHNATAADCEGAVYFPALGLTGTAPYATPAAALATVKETVRAYGIEIAGGE